MKRRDVNFRTMRVLIQSPVTFFCARTEYSGFMERNHMGISIASCFAEWRWPGLMPDRWNLLWAGSGLTFKVFFFALVIAEISDCYMSWVNKTTECHMTSVANTEDC